MKTLSTKPYTKIFARYLAIFTDCRADGIACALREIERRSTMDDYPELTHRACPAAIALVRVMERGSADLHWKIRGLGAGELARLFVRALRSDSMSVWDFERFFAGFAARTA